MATKPIANAYEITLQIVEPNLSINEEEEYVEDISFSEIFSAALGDSGLNLVSLKIRTKKLGGF